MKDLYNFEKSLKKKLDEQEFPFDEKNWEKARVMIDASRNNHKPWILYSLSAIVVIVSSSLFYYYSSGNQTVKKETLLAINEKAVRNYESSGKDVPANKNSDTEISSDNVLSADPFATIEKSKNHMHSSAQKTEDATTANNTEKINKNLNELSIKKTTSEISDLENKTVVNNSDKIITKTKALSGKENSLINQAKETPKMKNQEQPKSSGSTEIPAVLGSNNSQVIKSTIENSGAAIVNTNKLGDITSSDTHSQNKKTLVTDSVGAVKNDSYLEVSVNPSDTSSIIPFVQPDSSTIAANQAATEPPFKVKQTKNSLSAELGTTYLFGWSSNGTQEANGFNSIAGLNYQYNLNSVFSIGIGAQYNTINNLSNSSYSVSSVKYDFGVQKEITCIKYMRLHYITLPVKIGLNIGKNNTIGAGANFSTLVNSDSKNEKYQTNNADQMNESNRLSTKKEKGYLTGFSAYDIQASVFYRRIIYKGFSMKAEFVYGLNDIKNNDHFKNNNFERSTGAKLSICYDLFKK